jgi:hypothetical protein
MSMGSSGETGTTRLPKACYIVGVVLLLYLGAAIGFVLLVHSNVVGCLSATWLLRDHAMCAGFGMMGSSIASMRKYYRVLITDSANSRSGNTAQTATWDFGWVYYYLTRPLVGGVLGALSFTLSFVGFQALAKLKRRAIFAVRAGVCGGILSQPCFGPSQQRGKTDI